MTYPSPRVTGTEVPQEVEQEFDIEIARHQANPNSSPTTG